jgi:GTPase SAR1 family protein
MDMSAFDITGQRGFRNLVRETYFHGAQSLMAVCDLTRLDSLTALDEWIPSSLEIAGNVPVLIVVTKEDLADRRAFSDDQLRQVSELYSAPFVLTSAKTGEFVEDAFNALAVEIANRAMRAEQARVAEQGLPEKVLLLLSKRGTMGLKRSQLFEILRGVNYDELQSTLLQLEREGEVVILWNGPADLTATITPEGAEHSGESSSFLEE